MGKCVKATFILRNFIRICGAKENEDRVSAHQADCSAPALSDIGWTGSNDSKREAWREREAYTCIFPVSLFVRIMDGPHAETTS